MSRQPYSNEAFEMDEQPPPGHDGDPGYHGDPSHDGNPGYHDTQHYGWQPTRDAQPDERTSRDSGIGRRLNNFKQYTASSIRRSNETGRDRETGGDRRETGGIGWRREDERSYDHEHMYGPEHTHDRDHVYGPEYTHDREHVYGPEHTHDHEYVYGPDYTNDHEHVYFQDRMYEGDYEHEQAPSNVGWEGLLGMLPSQMDKNTGTLRFRRSGSVRSRTSAAQDTVEEDQPQTEAEVTEALLTLRDQPWKMALRKHRRLEYKKQLEKQTHQWYSNLHVSSIVHQGGSTINKVIQSLDPWQKLLKRIEGRHGVSVAAVFNFLRDMIQLNFLLSLILLGGLVLPAFFLVEEEQLPQTNCWVRENDNCSNWQIFSDAVCSECNANYTTMIERKVNNSESNFVGLVGDFLQGTGFLEWTLLFSGWYPAALDEVSGYHTSLAYLLTTLVVYLVSLIYVVYFVAKFLKQTSLSSEDYGLTFSNLIFTGWNFGITDKGAAKSERNLIVCEVKTSFADMEFRIKRESLRTRDFAKLYFIRFLINLIIIILLIGGWVGIFYLVQEVNKEENKDLSGPKAFVLEYAPTVVISGLNLFYPPIFDFLVNFEQYTGKTALLVTLIRSVLVRLTSLGILIISKLSIIASDERTCDYTNEYICWETHMGQQVYAVLILDGLIVPLGITFVVNILRWLCGKLSNRFLKMFELEFYVPGHVLDVVYIQTLCWLGVLYAPLMPVIVLFNLILTFFTKLFTVTVTCIPATKVFRASRSSAMFMTILSVSMALSIVASGIGILLIEPSHACSPFRYLGYSWESLTFYICGLDTSSTSWIRSVLFTLDDPSVVLVVLVVVVCFATYYISLVKARSGLITRLEEKLKIASKEKNYLVEVMNNASGTSASAK